MKNPYFAGIEIYLDFVFLSRVSQTAEKITRAPADRRAGHRDEKPHR